MTEAPAKLELDLGDIPAAARPRGFWTWFPVRRASDLHLREETAAAIREKDRQHLDLLHHHSLARVQAFYNEELIPAAARLPTGTERWRLWFELRCRLMALKGAAGVHHELVEHAEQLKADLPYARFADDAENDREARQQIRVFLAHQLAAAAERLRRDGQRSETLRAYAALDGLGAASPAHRAAHARLLWQLGDRSPEALRVYLRAREGSQSGHATGAFPAELDRFVEESLAVAEELPPHELEERLFLNQLALCSPRPSHPAWRNAGLAYLRLGRPVRALPYLERAHALNGSDGGALAFYLGQARFHVQDYVGSAGAFEEATAHGYSKVRIAAWLGLAYARLKQWECARDIFLEAEIEAGEVQPSELYLNWGRASFVMDEVEDALLRFEKAATADPDDSRAFYGRALCRQSRGEPDRALAELRTVAERWPQFAPAAHHLGLLLETAGDLAAATGHFRQAVTLSPRDPEYRLSLGLALENTGNPEAQAHLEMAAESGVGGPEVLRRLFLCHLRQGDRQAARRWLSALAKAEPAAPAVALFRTRDLASQATEAFNAGHYQEAVALWNEVAADRAGEAAVEERLALALALVHDAATRLREGEVAGVGEAMERAFQLAPELPGCRYLHAACRLVEGDAGTAARLLRGLSAEQRARSEVSSLAAAAAALAGEEATESQPSSGLLETPSRSLLELLQLLAAAANGHFEEAAQRCETWLAEPEAVRGLELPSDTRNALVAEIKLRGTRRKRQQVVRFLEALEARDGAGSWTSGVVLAKQLLATEKGLARAGEAELTELLACKEAYRGLFAASPAGAEAIEMRDRLGERYARLVLFLACHYAQRGRLPAALDVLKELESLPTPLGVGDLEKILRQRLGRPSHETAYALLDEDPDAAHQTWEALLAKDSGDLLARHHLACLAWSRAYDTVLAQRLEDSLPFWREGLEHFRQLYASESYWQSLLAKGRALGSSAAYPFDEKAFATWHQNALYQLASTVLQLIFHTLAGVDLADAKKDDVGRARALMSLVRDSKLDEATRQRLADDLAHRYLDPDPTRVADFARSRARAEKVVEIDPASAKARTFLLRSVTYEVSTRSQEGDRDAAVLVKLLAGVERHADWLAKRRQELPAERQERAARDLAAYYDQFGLVSHQEGQVAIGRHNQGSVSAQEKRRLLEAVLKAYRDSDRRFETSLALDPVNPHAKRLLEMHRDQCAEIERGIRLG